MKKLLFILIPTAFVLNSFGPTADVKDFKYSVLLDGKPIGSYSVNQTSIGDATSFRVETETAAGLIGRISHKFVMLSSFDKNHLVAADMKTWVNGELETSSAITWNGDQYVKRDGMRSTDICLEKVDFSSANIFFEEPVGRTEIFYEKYGQSLPLKALGDHQYEVKLPNGAVERYLYEDGNVSELLYLQSFTTIMLRAS